MDYKSSGISMERLIQLNITIFVRTALAGSKKANFIEWVHRLLGVGLIYEPPRFRASDRMARADLEV